MGEATYDFLVKTGDMDCAGTDANVSITVFGDKGETDQLRLAKSSAHLNKFEKGQVDVFQAKMKDVGNICKCVVEHDNKGLGSSWYLQYVEIKKDSQTYRFDADQWMEKGEQDTTKIALEIK